MLNLLIRLYKSEHSLLCNNSSSDCEHDSRQNQQVLAANSSRFFMAVRLCVTWGWREQDEVKNRRKREVRGGRERKRWMKGRQEDDSAAFTAAAAVIGSHHSSAIFATSPPIYLDCLCVCHFPSGRESKQQKERQRKRREGEREREQLGLVKSKKSGEWQRQYASKGLHLLRSKWLYPFYRRKDP